MRHRARPAFIVLTLAALAVGAVPGRAARESAPPSDTPPSSRFT